MEDTVVRREGMIAYAARIVRGTISGCFDFLGEHIRIVMREPALFLGVALLLIGLMSFETDKYCDGNTAQYLSCTRPAVYYYFDALDITFAVIGAFLLLAWFVKRRA